MTETTRTVFEKYLVRKTKKQKSAFIDYVQTQAAAEGYGCRVEKGYCGARNIVVGDPDRAKVIYTAHYDTCARLPFPNFITPKHIGIYLLYQIALTVLLLGVPLLILIGEGLLLSAVPMGEAAKGLLMDVSLLVLLVAELWLMLAGPANKHTANDNTSGVTVLLDTMLAMPQDLRGEVAFIFFDLEEMGLFGSAGFAARHKPVAKHTLLLNFDCVSDGATILFAVNRGAKRHIPALQNAFPAGEDRPVVIASEGVLYPSDQAWFLGGVGVAALKRSRRGILYMDRIHTDRDTVYEEANITYLTEGAIRLLREMVGTPLACSEPNETLPDSAL